MKTLLQINTVVNSGSTGRIAEDIGKFVINNGWESYIAYGLNDMPSASQKIKIGHSIDIILHFRKTQLLDRHGFGSKCATKRLIRRIKEIKPDVIHLHNLHGYYINIRVLFNYLSQANIPVVWTLHDCWAYTGHCAYHDMANCIRWETGCYSCPLSYYYPGSKLLDNSKKNYRQKRELFTSVSNMTMVAVSKWHAGNIARSFLNKYPIRVIYNGIDTDVFRPYPSVRAEYNIPDDKFMVFGVANIWEIRKGLEDFVALSRVVGEDTQIVLVGLPQEKIDALPENIIGIPRTENMKRLAELYSSADVHACLSVLETMGMTIYESLSCGTPAVVYLTHERNGWRTRQGGPDLFWGHRRAEGDQRGIAEGAGSG